MSKKESFVFAKRGGTQGVGKRRELGRDSGRKVGEVVGERWRGEREEGEGSALPTVRPRSAARGRGRI